jgi:AAA15 family ATPase/GTPase
MLTKVHIKNFKSIRELEFSPKRVNVFIGEPNTGKTNILEALALLSEGVHGPTEFKEVFRFRSIADLFTDQQVAEPIHIHTPFLECYLSYTAPYFRFASVWSEKGNNESKSFSSDQGGNSNQWVNLQYGIKYYRFKPVGLRTDQQFGSLTPPFGSNLASILYTDKGLRRRVSDLFRSRNFRLEIKPVEMEIRIAKVIEDEFYNFPYESISETWRRIIFYMAVLETNKNSTILLDEPEANTFPFYTAYLAERIALDESNQFILTTHNPYILSSIVSKTPTKDLAVFVASMDNFYTTLKLVSGEGLSKILDYGPDAFLNLDKLVEA